MDVGQTLGDTNLASGRSQKTCFPRRLGLALVAGAALAVTSLPASSAQAQNSTGFALNRFDPSERGSDWFWAESLDFRGHNRWAIGVVGDWAYKPLVAYDQNGDEVSALVENQIYGHLGASVLFWDRLRLAVSVPVLLYQNGDPTTLDGVTYTAPEGAAFGDIRVGADVRLFGTYGDVITGAIGGQVHIPTGDQASYTSDGSARFVPRLMVAGDIGIFTYAVKTGFNFRLQEEDFAGQPFGNEWTFGGAAGLRLLEKKLTIGPEIWASTVMSDGSAGFFDEGATPFEGVFGAHYQIKDFKVGAGVGPGFTRGLGSPLLRTLVSVEWFPEPKEEERAETPLDSDGDGILDKVDACVSERGPKSDDPSTHGCPLPDTDRDGILDIDDRCVNEPGAENKEDPSKHGCPLPKDADQDGILDPDDACVNQPGPANTEEPSRHGCPLTDNDGDGILNEDDACPETPGVENTDKQKHGCPEATIKDGQVLILDKIEFDSGKATISNSSLHILKAVQKILVDHSEIKKLRIEGHTDDRGADWYNKKLSDDRAKAVVTWLTEQGVDGARLTSQGFGEEKPIDDNKTEEGRQNNRRVEFHIVEATDVEDAGGNKEKK